MFFKSLASGVRSAFSALAVLFMANPEPPDIEYLFPRGRRDSSLSVRYWAQLAFCPGVSRETANNTFVKSATHYKSRRGKEHERLLIELRVPSPGTQDIFTAFIITERGPDPDDKRRSSELSLASSLNQSSPSISQPDDSIHANDIVVVCGTRKHQSPAHIKHRLRENYDALCTVTPTKPMSLAELAILMTVVNNHAISYDLLKYQCYWYTYTVWEVIRTHFGGEVTGNTEENRRGKYMGVPITRGDSVAAITETFETEWKTLCDKERGDTEAARIKQAEERGVVLGTARERARFAQERQATERAVAERAVAEERARSAQERQATERAAAERAVAEERARSARLEARYRAKYGPLDD